MDLPDVYFGKVKDEEIDWREDEEIEQDNDEDKPISEDVKAILGFDPDKEGEQ